MLAFDVESIGLLESELPSETLAFLSKNPEKKAENLDRLALSPYTAFTACIGLWDTEAGKGIVLLNMAESELPPDRETWAKPDVVYKCCNNEEGVLRAFWRIAGRQHGSFLSYNGRSWDVPYLVVRSGVYGIPCNRKLVRSNRYNDEHIDLQDCLSAYGSFRMPVNFDLLCRTLGVPSPKVSMTGAEVGDHWRAGRKIPVANYCMDDVIALVSCGRRFDGLYGSFSKPETEETETKDSASPSDNSEV